MGTNEDSEEESGREVDDSLPSDGGEDIAVQVDVMSRGVLFERQSARLPGPWADNVGTCRP